MGFSYGFASMLVLSEGDSFPGLLLTDVSMSDRPKETDTRPTTGLSVGTKQQSSVWQSWDCKSVFKNPCIVAQAVSNKCQFGQHNHPWTEKSTVSQSMNGEVI